MYIILSFADAAFSRTSPKQWNRVPSAIQTKPCDITNPNNNIFPTYKWLSLQFNYNQSTKINN